jgi:hypothetical protein
VACTARRALTTAYALARCRPPPPRPPATSLPTAGAAAASAALALCLLAACAAAQQGGQPGDGGLPGNKQVSPGLSYVLLRERIQDRLDLEDCSAICQVRPRGHVPGALNS